MRIVLIGPEIPDLENFCQKHQLSFVWFRSTLEFESVTTDTSYTGTVKTFIINYNSNQVGRELTSDMVEYLRHDKNFDETILTTVEEFSDIPGLNGVVSLNGDLGEILDRP